MSTQLHFLSQLHLRKHEAKDCDEGAHELPKVPHEGTQGCCCSKCFNWVNAGVNYVGLEGEEKDKLVVIGDEVDPVKLTNSLRKKVGHTDIISLAEVKAS
ncbi:Heavy metal-associated isoprenylated plant protein 47 isoform D [Glycine soja]|uniref:Heavy metal-associated isoprenylated plant protein 47 isoform D n=1 Tax=Glycine soja TaxID=3848 RepID=A0A445GST2_GLYSO|nr:Heavy metal-associated isoprenylated plant protein 47 isoform D [Glycine soja]